MEKCLYSSCVVPIKMDRMKYCASTLGRFGEKRVLKIIGQPQILVKWSQTQLLVSVLLRGFSATSCVKTNYVETPPSNTNIERCCSKINTNKMTLMDYPLFHG